ncbi:MAG: hypothetical protein AB8F94_17235 [Saprospiraceae bacterium]
MKNLGIFSLMLLLFFSSCRKDERLIDTTVTTPNPTIESYIPPSDMVIAGVIGFVVDENQTPVEDAVVKLNGSTFTTDAYGHVFIENENLNALGTLVEVEKDGYFEGSRRFFPIEGKQSRIKIQLLEKTFDKSFVASNGGIIEISNGAKVEFSPSSIKTADGNSYSGTVHVAAKWMDPSLSTTLDQMPGNLQGVNIEVEQMALATYGMIAVELEGDAGESLNIADGNTAKITMPVPSSMLNAAPSEIPLWSYNKEFGLWVEESKATLQGDKYVGDVSHFSFWNCDIPMDYVNLEMTLVDDNGNPLNNYLVTLTLAGASTSGSGYSDQNGNVSGFVPANEILTMNVLDACGDVLFTQEIGEFSVDTDLGDITISGINVNATTITGNLLDCNGSPLTEGIVIAQFQGQTIYQYTATSNFSMTFSSCSNTSDIEVIGIDPSSLEQSDIVLATPNVQNDLGDINVCGTQLQNFITITIDGVTGVFTNNIINANANSTYIESLSPSQGHYIGFGFDGTTTGDYTTTAYSEGIFSTSLGWSYDLITFTSFEVTQYDTKVVGSFTGDIYDNSGTLVPITCTFNVPF